MKTFEWIVPVTLDWKCYDEQMGQLVRQKAELLAVEVTIYNIEDQQVFVNHGVSYNDKLLLGAK